MGKSKIIQELVNILTIALRHKIGSIVNENEFYAAKYAKDYESFLKEAEKVTSKKNWNNENKIQIKEKLKKQLREELETKTFLKPKKFDIMEEQIEYVLKNLNLSQ